MLSEKKKESAFYTQTLCLLLVGHQGLEPRTN